MAKFFKTKKIWTKNFSKEELNKILKAWKQAAKISEEMWEGNERIDRVLKELDPMEQFVHLETDKFDDTVGVQPEQVREFMETNAYKEGKVSLKKFFKKIQKKGRKTLEERGLYPYVTDGYVEWEQFADEVLEDL